MVDQPVFLFLNTCIPITFKDFLNACISPTFVPRPAGDLSEQELYVCMKKLPSFKDLSRAECKRFFDIIDRDHSGR